MICNYYTHALLALERWFNIFSGPSNEPTRWVKFPMKLAATSWIIWTSYPLVIQHSDIENGPVEIVSFPMKKRWSFRSYVNVYQRVITIMNIMTISWTLFRNLHKVVHMITYNIPIYWYHIKSLFCHSIIIISKIMIIFWIIVIFFNNDDKHILNTTIS